MVKLLMSAAAAALLAGPAAAQPDPIFDAELDARVAASIPSSEEVEALAPAIDRMSGALLDLDVGPLMHAADPWRRHRGRHTLRDIAGRDDPYFEHRLRGSIYGTTAGIGRMMDAIAVAAPAMRRSLSQMEREMALALDRAPPRYEDRRYDDDRPYHDDGPYYEDEGDEPYWD